MMCNTCCRSDSRHSVTQPLTTHLSLRRRLQSTMVAFLCQQYATPIPLPLLQHTLSPHARRRCFASLSCPLQEFVCVWVGVWVCAVAFWVLAFAGFPASTRHRTERTADIRLTSRCSTPLKLSNSLSYGSGPGGLDTASLQELTGEKAIPPHLSILAQATSLCTLLPRLCDTSRGKRACTAC